MAAIERIRVREGAKYGGSAEGIRSHYDVSNDFWPSVLGRTMAYSCALYSSPDEDLDIAQTRKIEWHLANAGAHAAQSVLDIGCGWGSVLRPLSELDANISLTGITLSAAQATYVAALGLPRVEVCVENWADHEPKGSYDSIISIGAFEHFAKPEETLEEKIAVYRDFFERCYKWLSPGGLMTLQTMAFHNMKREDASEFMNNVIFPDSDLPFLRDILAALEGLFEVVTMRDDRLDYARTMDAWARNLYANRETAEKLIGQKKATDMERYFKLTSMGFRMGKQSLLRFALRPISKKWSLMGAENWRARSFSSVNIGRGAWLA